MNAELIAVGTELLLGQICNTDGQFISRQLAGLGINVFYHTVVGDNPSRLAAVLNTALERSDLIITTGGLGPTYDDLTKEVIASVLNLELTLHQPSLARLESFFSGRGRAMTDNNRKQAYLPDGAIAFDNDWGTAPGCAIERNGKTVVMLPGPPRECEPMMTQRVLPYLSDKSDGVLVSQEIHIFGMGESAVEHKLEDMMRTYTNPTVAPYAKESEVMLRVTAKAADRAAAQALVAPVVENICSQLGDCVYSVDIETLEAALVDRLSRAGLTLAVAESCTGGLVATRITDIPGCSAVFRGGIVSYDNQLKTDLLDVPHSIIEQHGAVSRPVALAMARGVARRCASDIGVGITGIAGPGGGSDEKPVGLVYIALHYRGVSYVKELRLGTRNAERGRIRRTAASNAIHMALKLAKKL